MNLRKKLFKIVAIVMCIMMSYYTIAYAQTDAEKPHWNVKVLRGSKIGTRYATNGIAGTAISYKDGSKYKVFDTCGIIQDVIVMTYYGSSETYDVPVDFTVVDWSESSVEPMDKIMYVKSLLWVRGVPSYWDCQIIDNLREGTAVHVTGKGEFYDYTSLDDGIERTTSWYRIECNGVTGFVDYLVDTAEEVDGESSEGAVMNENGAMRVPIQGLDDVYIGNQEGRAVGSRLAMMRLYVYYKPQDFAIN